MGYKDPRRLLCGAKNRDGSACKRWAIRGRNRCRQHGGASPVGGPTHPAYKSGRYSSVLPAGLRTMYEAAANAPDLLAQTDEAAILTARINQVLAGVRDAGETAQMWRQALDEFRAWQKALNHTAAAQGRNDTAGVEQYSRQAAESSERLGVILATGAADADHWREFRDTVDVRRRVVESERKRMVESSMMMPFAQVCVIFDSLIEVLRGEIADAGQLARITGKLAGHLGRPHPVADAGGGG